MWRDKLLMGLTILLFMTGIGTIGYVLLKGYVIQEQFESLGELSCVEQELKSKMKDSHLAGIIDKDEPIRILLGFYDCNPIQRGDLVFFRISPPIEPVVKVVYGIPGDKFEVKETEVKNQWHILINGKTVEVEDGPYFIQSRHTPPLKTYERAKKGTLGKDDYIILSNVPPGLSDSSNLGLVRRVAFEGKVLSTELD